MTHLSVGDQGSPFDGRGFSIISYTSDFGSGEGWSYDEVVAPGRVQLIGLFTSPLTGIVSATLSEAAEGRSLVVTVGRIDFGLPPTANLNVANIWGPGRVSPGQTVTYCIEYRNDGVRTAENMSVVCSPFLLSDCICWSPGGVHDPVIHSVRWDMRNIRPHTSGTLYLQLRIFWGLPLNYPLSNFAFVCTPQEADEIFTHHTDQKPEGKLTVEKIWYLITEDPCGPVILGLDGIGNGIPLTEQSWAWVGPRLKGLLDGLDEKDPCWGYVFAANELLKAIKTDRNYLGGKTLQIELCRLSQAAETRCVVKPCKFSGTRGFEKSRITPARDPNIKYGPEGIVLPGQKLDYKVEFENEGEGIAFGVYFTDTLDEDLDDSTVGIGPVISTKDGSVIAPPGTYNAETRTITWLVGEVGPGEGGFADISVNVKSDAAEGTEILNFGVVYFPSVPEVTRTNGIVSIVPYSKGAVTAFAGVGEELTVQWEPFGDGQYTVQTTADLAIGVWTDAPGEWPTVARWSVVDVSGIKQMFVRVKAGGQ